MERTCQTEARKGGSMFQRLKEFWWGLFVFDLYKETLSEKKRYEDALNLIFLGEFLGIPLMNSTISLRLLPYLWPQLRDFKIRQLREREVIEQAPEIH